MNEEQYVGWGGKFGDRYTKRNPTLSDFHYTDGKTRLELTKVFHPKKSNNFPNNSYFIPQYPVQVVKEFVH